MLNQLTHQSFIFGAMLVSSYIVLFMAEHIWPLRKTKASPKARILVNLAITAFVLLVASLLIGPLVKYTLSITSTYNLGLLKQIRLPSWAAFAIGFLLMDLSMYYWHRLNHRFGFLWRFHNVHHVDLDLDVTTSMRFHFIEIAYSVSIRFVQIILIGVEPLLYICYELVFQLATFFHHSNIKMPIIVERLINTLFVTPRMHGIHHSHYMTETNSNYGIVFPWWDHIHRTIKLNIPQKNITIGVPAYESSKDNTLIQLLLMPFKSQRRYWEVDNHRYFKRSLGSERSPKKLAE